MPNPPRDDSSNDERERAAARAADALRAALSACVESVKANQQTLNHPSVWGGESPSLSTEQLAALEQCVREYARCERAAGSLAERTLIRVKELLVSIDAHEPGLERLEPTVTKWLIEAYYAPPTA